jgi:hypothetical protein
VTAIQARARGWLARRWLWPPFPGGVPRYRLRRAAVAIQARWDIS